MSEYTIHSPQYTKSLGRNLGKLLKGGEIIHLHGDLGAGKTLLTKGIAEGLYIEDSATVVSPSFTLVNIYKAKLDIVHVDLYRLNSDEIYELGLEDYMDQGHIMVVEWAEKVHDFFSGQIVDLTIEYAGEATRKVILNCERSVADPRITGLFPG